MSIVFRGAGDVSGSAKNQFNQAISHQSSHELAEHGITVFTAAESYIFCVEQPDHSALFVDIYFCTGCTHSALCHLNALVHATRLEMGLWPNTAQ